MIARIFKTRGKNSPPLLYFAHTIPKGDLKDALFLIANTGFKGDKEFIFNHPGCIGGLVQNKNNKAYLNSLGKIGILGGDIQQRTFLRCIHSVDTIFWGNYNYSIDYDFFWIGSNPEIKRTYEFLNIILKTNLRGWVFACNQMTILEQLGLKFNQIQLFPDYYIYNYNNIFIDCNPLYEQNYFEHILNHSSLLISTSIHEGIFPNSFLEAWSRNIPVIMDQNMKSYIFTLKGIEDFVYIGLDLLVEKIYNVLTKLDEYQTKVKEFKKRYLATDPIKLNFILHNLCKEYYEANGYNWNGDWYGFLAPYPMEIII